MSDISPISHVTLPQTENPRDHEIWNVAQKMEASFLAEMLKSTSLGSTSESFGGGQGEEQFGSFLRQAQADLMVKAGGIGLAEALFESLKQRAAEHV